MRVISLLAILVILTLSKQIKVNFDPINTHQFPESLQIKITIDGKIYAINLVQNKELFAPNYKLYEMGADGKVVLSSSQTTKFCHYVGSSDDNEVQHVVVSTCSGAVEGSFYFQDEKYIIKSNGMAEIDHEIYKAKEKRSDMDNMCGEPKIPNKKHDELKKVKSTTKRAVKEKKYVEYLAFNDNELRLSYGTNVTDFTSGVVAQARQYYERMATSFNYIIEIVLIAQITLTSTAPWTIPSADPIDTSLFLDSVTAYLEGQPTGLPQHDNVGIISGHKFKSPVIGLAWLGTMCSISDGQSVHVIDATSKDISDVGSTVAHEMGHNFNMSHDGTANGNSCPSTGFVMQPALSIVPTYFSSCSTTYINNFFAYDTTGRLSCLNNIPSSSSDKTCGNGFVDKDKGEQCDCGTIANCDPCCNAATCKYATGAQCSPYDGSCCTQSCTIVAKGTTCRKAGTTCETDSTCNGADGSCPASLLPDKSTCGSNGACFSGICASLDNQCRALTGYSTTFQECTSSTPAVCGQLVCGRQSNPSSCAKILDADSNDVLVENGVPCGSGKYCDGKGSCTASGGATGTGTGSSTNDSGKIYGNIVYILLLLSYLVIN